MVNRSGRPPGRPRAALRTKAAIREAARVRFNRDGYRATTLRSIAEDAGVDAALIYYYFGSKHRLLAAVLAIRTSPATILERHLALPMDEFPYAVLTALLRAWESPEDRPALFAQVVSVGQDPTVTPLVREFIELELVRPLARRLERDGVAPADARMRAGVFASNILGLVFARYVLAVRPIAQPEPRAIVDGLAPTLVAVLNGQA